MATARLNLIGEKFSFKVNDNPLIHGLDEKLEMGLKQFVDFLKTDEYRGYVVWNGVCGMEWGMRYGMGYGLGYVVQDFWGTQLGVEWGIGME